MLSPYKGAVYLTNTWCFTSYKTYYIVINGGWSCFDYCQLIQSASKIGHRFEFVTVGSILRYSVQYSDVVPSISRGEKKFLYSIRVKECVYERKTTVKNGNTDKTAMCRKGIRKQKNCKCLNYRDNQSNEPQRKE